MRFINSQTRGSKRARFGRKIVCSYCAEEHIGRMHRLTAFKNDGRLVCACDRHLPQLIHDARIQERRLPELEYFLSTPSEEDLEAHKLRVAIKWRYAHLSIDNQYRKMFNHVQVKEPRRKTTRD
jgi:hypothetical protein